MRLRDRLPVLRSAVGRLEVAISTVALLAEVLVVMLLPCRSTPFVDDSATLRAREFGALAMASSHTPLRTIRGHVARTMWGLSEVRRVAFDDVAAISHNSDVPEGGPSPNHNAC